MPVYIIENKKEYYEYMKSDLKFDVMIYDSMYVESLHGCRLVAGTFSGRAREVSNKDKLRYYINSLDKLETGDVFSFFDDKKEMNFLFVVLPNIGSKTTELLFGCYYNVLKYAVEHNYKSIYLPVFYIGSMAYRTSDAYICAARAVNRIVTEHNDITIYLHTNSDCRPGEASKYLSNHSRARLNPDWEKEYCSVMNDTEFIRKMVTSPFKAPPQVEPRIIVETKTEYVNLNPKFDKEKFSEYINEYIKTKNSGQAKLARSACIDKGTVNKLISCENKSKPQKNTVVSLAIAMDLNEDERKEFIMSGGYYYPDDDRDKKIEECIRNGIKSVADINDKLYDCNYASLTKDNYKTNEKRKRKNKTNRRKKPITSEKSRS